MHAQRWTRLAKAGAIAARCATLNLTSSPVVGLGNAHVANSSSPRCNRISATSSLSSSCCARSSRMPADSVAKCVWEAYHGKKLHYYVPAEIAWIDRIKGFAPNYMRNRIMKMLPMLNPDAAQK